MLEREKGVQQWSGGSSDTPGSKASDSRPSDTEPSLNYGLRKLKGREGRLASLLGLTLNFDMVTAF